MATSLDDAHLVLSRPAGPISLMQGKNELERSTPARRTKTRRTCGFARRAIGGSTSRYEYRLVAQRRTISAASLTSASDPKRQFPRGGAARCSVGDSLLSTSLIVTGLVRKARSQTEETLKAEDELQRSQAELATSLA
jgi:hypothetical protein